MILPGQQAPVTREIAARSPLAALVPRWVWLALPDDAAQCCWMAEAMHPHRPAAQRAELRYMIRELARTAWRREILRPAPRPPILRPSKQAHVTGYRTDSARHYEARMKLSPERRAEIARKGAAA
jgi:hypothetical protein